MGYKPQIAALDEVTISREGYSAVIKFNDSTIGAIHLEIGATIKFMNNSEILELHNAIVRAQLESPVHCQTDRNCGTTSTCSR